MKSKLKLQIAVFLCGAIVMIYELVGSRVLGPFFGTSIYTWTSLIAIILGSLSLGYYLGGKYADKNANIQWLAFIIFISAVFMAITMGIKDVLLFFLQSAFEDHRWSIIIASIILFSPVSVFLGMVSPYALKLMLTNLKTSGRTAGNLYALSTLGSIFGTLFAGFFLIPNLGTNRLIIILTAALVLISIMLSFKKRKVLRVSVLILICLSLLAFGKLSDFIASKGYIDIDTAYNRIMIITKKNKDNVKIRSMKINNESHSSMYLESDSLYSLYAKSYHIVKHFKPNFKQTLMLGGAGYSFPKNYLKVYKNASIDVIEIDEKVTELARKYFNLKDNPRLKIYHKDARTYLNHTKKKYDAIFGDAFSSGFSVPYQLTTIEAVKKHYDVLTDDGVVILNLITSLEGDSSKLLRAEYATYKKVFPHVLVIPLSTVNRPLSVQNTFLIALKSKTHNFTFENEDPFINKLLKNVYTKDIPQDLPILTDNYAPVDDYMLPIQQKINAQTKKTNKGLWDKVKKVLRI